MRDQFGTPGVRTPGVTVVSDYGHSAPTNSVGVLAKRRFSAAACTRRQATAALLTLRFPSSRYSVRNGQAMTKGHHRVVSIRAQITNNGRPPPTIGGLARGATLLISIALSRFRTASGYSQSSANVADQAHCQASPGSALLCSSLLQSWSCWMVTPAPPQTTTRMSRLPLRLSTGSYTAARLAPHAGSTRTR